MSKYKYNKDYFNKIDTPDKAYWFGFTCADGCITSFYRNEKLKAMSLEFTLQKRDKRHLEKFLEALDSNVTIRDKTAKCGEKNYPACRLNINCTKMCRDLIDLGCTPQKTFTFRFPKENILPRHLVRDFLRGYFDGDGCINVSEMAGKPHIICTFTGTKLIIGDLIEVLINEGVIRKRPKVTRKKDTNSFSFFIHGTDDVYEFLSYLYDDSHYYLDRKYNEYEKFYKDFNYNESKRGIYWDKHNKAYVASITINGERTRLGQFKNIDDAIKARKEAEIQKMKILNSPLNQ